MDAIGIIFAQLLYNFGDCRLPLSIGPAVATRLFEMRSIASGRRVATNQRSMKSQGSGCRELCQAVRRNVSRARVRLALEQARSHVGADEEIRDRDGNIFLGPSANESIPPVSHEAMSAETSFSTLDPTWDEERGGNLEGTSPNPDAPKRDGAPFGAPGSKIPKIRDTSANAGEDLPVTQRRKIEMHEAQVVVTTPQKQLRRSGREPNRG